MKFISLGYLDEARWEVMSAAERDALLDECFAYDELLRKNGHFLAGEMLQRARTARTVHWKNGKAMVTDGPHTETKEQIGGLVILEARDLDHAVELMSKHPAVKAGPFEIRPAGDRDGLLLQSLERRRA
jgi:hypothetical protein